MFGYKMDGIPEVIKALDGLGDAAQKAFEKTLLQAGDMIARDARKRLPAGASRGGAPLSRWKGSGRTSGGFPLWTTATDQRKQTRVKLRKARAAHTRATRAVVTEGGPAAVVFDLAGKNVSASESQFVANLQAKWGIQPRALKRSEIEEGPKAQAKAQKAMMNAIRAYVRSKRLGS